MTNADQTPVEDRHRDAEEAERPREKRRRRAGKGTTAGSRRRAADRDRAARRDPGTDADALDDRTVRARTERMRVEPLGGGLYAVETRDDNRYTADQLSGRCTCPDHRYRGGWCKHLRRVADEVAAGRVPPPGLAPVDCSVCGDAYLAEEPVRPPYRCPRCSLEPGEFVVDRLKGDLVVVAEPPTGRADEMPVPGHDVTVAQYPGNERYPADDPVVEVLYPLRAGADAGDITPWQLRRYRFPLSRVRRAGEDERA